MPKGVATLCPSCHHKLDGWFFASGPGHVSPPEPGDYSVCFYCASLLQFDETLRPSLRAEVPQDDPELRDRIIRARDTIQFLVDQGRRGN